ncbi:MAG: amidohydrolase family protein [Acidobacteria bacterium]|nr:amidohydrolase family protein [Acidobacteriota bacterium]
MFLIKEKIMRKTSIFLVFAALCMFAATAATAQNGDVLIKNATVMTASKGTLQNTDILIQNGKITRIGKNLTSGSARVIDATGKYVTPGIIDAHSHAMLDAINESSFSVTSMTDVKDALDPDDISIYRALAGGTTAALLLHGSANSIGGQSATIKFKYGKGKDDFLIKDAPTGIKFAMGENVKRSNFNVPGMTPRYPRTRMGVVETVRDAFTRARDYRQAWADFNAKKTKTPPRRDLQLEPLVEILEGKRIVHAHGYRSDEQLNLLKIADEFGFKIGTLQHGLETYKFAPEIAKHGAGVSIFIDSWSYKIEGYDAIPFTAYMLWKQGIVVSINSDSDERIRRLNLDAAKAMKYGGVPEEDALKMVTLNPAIQLGIGKRTGSIEVGKDGDVVIWTGHPFSPYSRVETTMIEGEVYFDRAADAQKRTAAEAEKAALLKDKMNSGPATGSGPGAGPRIPRESIVHDRDHADQEKTGDTHTDQEGGHR